MGSFNVKCGITGLAIQVDDPVILVPIVQDYPLEVELENGELAKIPSGKWIPMFYDRLNVLQAKYSDYGKFDLNFDCKETVSNLSSLFDKLGHIESLPIANKDDLDMVLNNYQAYATDISSVGIEYLKQAWDCYQELENVFVEERIAGQSYTTPLAFFVFHKTAIDWIIDRENQLKEKNCEDLDLEEKWLLDAFNQENEDHLESWQRNLGYYTKRSRYLINHLDVVLHPVGYGGQRTWWSENLADITQNTAIKLSEYWGDSEGLTYNAKTLKKEFGLIDGDQECWFHSKEERDNTLKELADDYFNNGLRTTFKKIDKVSYDIKMEDPVW